MLHVLPVENMQPVLLSFLPFFHVYGLISTVFMALAAGYLVVTLTRFSLREVLCCIEKYKASELHLFLFLQQFSVFWYPAYRHDSISHTSIGQWKPVFLQQFSVLVFFAFSALTLLVGWQPGHSACKKTE